MRKDVVLMTRISRIGNTGAPGGPSKAKRAGGAFSATPAAAPETSRGADSVASASTLGALIALQSDDYAGGKSGNAKTIAAAQQVLDDLERLQHALLDTTRGARAIDALEQAAGLRAHAGADAKLINLYDEIALRARVELAKLGR